MIKASTLAMIGSAFVLVILATCAYLWNNPNGVQAVAAVGSFVATAALVVLTAIYVVVNRETLSILKEQWDQSHRLILRYGISTPHGKGRVWIANNGFSHVLITKIHLMRRGGDPFVIYKHAIIPPSRVRSFELSPDIWSGCELTCDVEVSLEYDYLGEPGTAAGKAYTLMPSLSRSSILASVKRGIHGVWTIHCPKCKKWLGMSMRTDGLTNFDRAAEREKAMHSELAASCPNHESRWMLTMETANPPAEED